MAEQLATQGTRKELTTLQAQFAMRGYELRHAGGDAFRVIRWGFVKDLQGLAAVKKFALEVGVQHG